LGSRCEEEAQIRTVCLNGGQSAPIVRGHTTSSTPGRASSLGIALSNRLPSRTGNVFCAPAAWSDKRGQVREKDAFCTPLRDLATDLKTGQMHVARSEWKGKVTVPKGGRSRRVPLSASLIEAFRAARRDLRSLRVLVSGDGQPLTQKMVQNIMRRIARKANVRHGVHILRHTFCSTLAARGVSARAIQDLAGHEDLTTTLGYMHVSPKAVDQAIRVLDGVPGWGTSGAQQVGEAAK
jgi:hypothetical protein